MRISRRAAPISAKHIADAATKDDVATAKKDKKKKFAKALSGLGGGMSKAPKTDLSGAKAASRRAIESSLARRRKAKVFK